MLRENYDYVLSQMKLFKIFHVFINFCQFSFCDVSLIFLPCLMEQAVVAWSCVLMFAAFKFLKWSALLSTWKGVAILTAALLLVTGVMHILILNSQAERTNPRKVALNGQNGGVPLNANQKKQNWTHSRNVGFMPFFLSSAQTLIYEILKCIIQKQV